MSECSIGIMIANPTVLAMAPGSKFNIYYNLTPQQDLYGSETYVGVNIYYESTHKRTVDFLCCLRSL